MSYVLGISGVFGHDASAAIVCDGRIKFVAEEERLTRDKRAVNKLPLKSTEECLTHLNINIEDIDYIAVSWSEDNVYGQEFLNKYLAKAGFKKVPKIRYIDHHISHAAYAISVSALKKGAILIVDGHSEGASCSIGRFSKDKIEILETMPISQSIGHFYEAVSNHLGFGYENVGKLMGLAAYGDENSTAFSFENLLDGELIERSFCYKKQCSQVLQLWSEHLTKYVEPIQAPHILKMNGILPHFAINSEKHINLAAIAQKVLEDSLLKLVKRVIEITGETDLVYGGGVALNCAANGKIEHSGLVNSLHLAPASGDSGTAIGAALAASDTIIRNQISPYLGKSFSNSEIKYLLEKYKINYKEYDEPEVKLAEFIGDGAIVGRFSGRAEIGPRALGNRSILACPRHVQMRDNVNKIKNRELWRPLSPSILIGEMNHCFQQEHKSPYMLKALKCNKNGTEYMNATIHKDNSARVQTVSREINYSYADLLFELGKKTGVSAVINTSFNDNFEPIVYKPLDAIRMFFSSGLSHLQLENFVVSK